MQITVYAKKRQTQEGKNFFSYITKLTKKDGTEVTTSVKFREDCGQPKGDQCPCNIIVEKGDCNFSTKTIVDEETGEALQSNTLWVNNWRMGDEFVDHSMDDFIYQFNGGH